MITVSNKIAAAVMAARVSRSIGTAYAVAAERLGVDSRDVVECYLRLKQNKWIKTPSAGE